MPDFAIEAGYDCDGTPIYVGRAKHHEEMLPAKIVPSKGCAYVSWGGKEHSKNYYEVLVGPGYGWYACENGTVPSTAVATGETAHGEPLYIGRGRHGNSLCVGKIHPSHRCLYIPFGGEETSLYNYEVLICENTDHWLNSSLESIPSGAVIAGFDSDNAAIFVGRSLHEGHFLPAKVVADRSEAYVSCDGSEIKTDQVEILCGNNYEWVTADFQNIPNNAVFTDRFEDGQPLFIGRTRHHNSLTPGLVSPKDQCIFIPFGGHEIRKLDFEMLVRC